MTTFIGIKDYMTQIWDKTGKRHAVTVLKTPPVTVTQVKSPEADGYSAVQVGVATKPSRLLKKPLQGHLKSVINKDVAPRYLREINPVEDEELKVGQTIDVGSRVSVGDRVAATAVTKGKGFAGVMKRWGFKGGPKTHGQSDRARAPGSIGQGTDPGRIHKGKKMAGHLGHVQAYVKNLTVLKIDVDTNEVWLSGPVPGPRGSLIKLQVLPFKNEKFAGLAAESEDTTSSPTETNTSSEQSPATSDATPPAAQTDTSKKQTPKQTTPENTEKETAKA